MQYLRQRVFRTKALPGWFALTLVLGILIGHESFGPAPRIQIQPSTADAMPADAKVQTAHTGTIALSGRMQLHPQRQMPARSAQEQQQEAANLARIQSLPAAPHGPVAQMDARALAASRGPAVSAPSKSNTGPQTSAGGPRADGGFVIVQGGYGDMSSAVCSPDCATASAMEPSIANDGKYVMMSGNWFDGITTNPSYVYGATWSAIDPYKTFVPTNEVFCCDQQVLYEPSRSTMVWESLWLSNAAGAPNSLVLAFSSGTDLNNWCWYNWTPASFGAPNTDLLTNPDIEYSTDNLWMSFNIYAGNTWVSTDVMRAPLTAQATCSTTVSYSYYSTTGNFSFALASGAQGNMYFDSNWYTSGPGSGSSVRICAWGDGASASPICFDRAIDPWPFISSEQNCASQDGVVTNWCTGLDSRRGTLYMTKANYRGFGPSSLGMAWSAAANPGAGFPFPYVVRNYFNLSGFVYDGHDNLWNAGYAVAYPSIAPNFRGFLGGSFAIGGGTGTGGSAVDYYPSTMVLLDDPVTPTQPWTTFLFAYGAGNATAWGNYNTIRALVPQGYMWLSPGWYVNSSNIVIPYEIIFGQVRDESAYSRWIGV